MSQVPSTATSSTDFETVFRAALESYKTQTKKDIASHPLATELQSCDSPSAILAVLRTQVQTSNQSQSADDRWTKWLDPTVNVLYAFSLALGNGVGLIFPPSNAIFAGIGVLLQAVKDVRAGEDALVDLFGRLEYFFKRLEAYVKVRPTAAMTDIIVKIMVEVLLILGVVTKEIRMGKMKKYLKKLLGEKNIEGALQRLDKWTQEEARMAAIEVLAITRGIDDKVKDVDEKVDGVDERVQSLDIKVEGIDGKVQSVDSKVQGVNLKVGSVIQGVKETGVAVQQVVDQVSDLNRNELRKDLWKWIAAPDPSVNYNASSNDHHDGTAAWCTEGNTLADWKTSGSLLWIHGKPGSGKSILSSVIIKHIKSLSNAGSARMAYFFFDFKDTGKQDSRALLSSILVQLSDRSEQLFDVLLRLHSAHQNGLEQPTDDSLARCLKDMLAIVGQVPNYLIVDALDECPNDSGIPPLREKVLELVKELVELRHPNLRLCITSRPEFDIRTTLEPLVTQQVSLHDESGQKQDIVDYITFVVRSDKNMKRWRDNDKDMVIEELTKKADGMFRWVFCQLEVLRPCFPANLRRTLEELPRSLDETYERILKEINNANWEHAHRLLQCLAVASRPLRVEELAEVLAFDFSTGPGGTAKLIADWRWEDQEEAVLSACSSLVSIISNEGSRVVQFSHFSVKEFLTSERLANSIIEGVSRFRLRMEASHVILAQACLGVLLRLDDRTDNDNVENIPLARYAAEYWHRHAQIGNVEFQIKDAMDYFFDMDKPHFSAWVRIQGLQNLLTVSVHEQPGTVPLSAAPLYFAAGRGFRGLVERLVSKHPQQVNHLGGLYGTPFHASVLGGHIEVAQLLFAHGADIKSRSADNWAPLHIASREGHLEVVKWLLNLGADVNFQKKDGLWTPLHFAVANGHLEVTRILLECNAAVNAWNGLGSTPLHLASAIKRPGVARLLLEYDADVHVRDNSGNTPLHLAASRESPEVARMILERNPEVNSQDDYGSTPLHKATKTGNSEIVLSLLDHGADADVRDYNGYTPLHLAAFRGYLEVAGILLERTAEIDSQDDRQATPLHRASKGGNFDVVQLLLNRDADVRMQDERGNTPLHLAAANGNPEVVRILLKHKHNVEVNSQNHKGSTPLHRASEGRLEGNLEIVRLLLDHGADAHLRNLKGETASELATGQRQQEIIQLLSEHAAE